MELWPEQSLTSKLLPEFTIAAVGGRSRERRGSDAGDALVAVDLQLVAGAPLALPLSVDVLAERDERRREMDDERQWSLAAEHLTYPIWKLLIRVSFQNRFGLDHN